MLLLGNTKQRKFWPVYIYNKAVIQLLVLTIIVCSLCIFIVGITYYISTSMLLLGNTAQQHNILIKHSKYKRAKLGLR